MIDRKKKIRRLLVALLLSPVVIAVVLVAISHLTMGSEFQRRVKELSEAGHPVSLADLEKRSVPKEGVENAADVYIEAFENYVRPSEAEMPFLPIRGNYELADKLAELPFEVTNAIDSTILKNKRTLELLHKAARMDYCLFPKTIIAPSCFMTEYKSDRKRAAMLLAEINLHLARLREIDRLFESLQTSIGLIRSFGEQPVLIDCILKWSLALMVTASMEDSLNHIVFSDEQLSILQQEFRSMYESDIMGPAMTNERALTVEFLKLSSGEQSRGWGISGGEGVLFHLYSMSSIKKRDALLLLDYYADTIEACGLAPVDRYERLVKINTDYGCYSNVHWLVRLYAYHNSYLQTDVVVKGQLLCAETSVAVERYRLKHGGLPDSLEGLVGEFIDEVPVDPFDGEAIRYRKLEEGGYMLYIIGEDGIDDGGLDKKQMIERNGGEYPESYDWPFVVRRRGE